MPNKDNKKKPKQVDKKAKGAPAGGSNSKPEAVAAKDGGKKR